MSFSLGAETLQELNGIALDGIDVNGGSFRRGRVIITNSEHRPPPAREIESLVEEMCLYVNRSWSFATAVHLAAYVMWRLNWIHPFADGNGRTSRSAGYLVLCARLGYLLPGVETFPEMIARNKARYHEALEDCDAAWREVRSTCGQWSGS